MVATSSFLDRATRGVDFVISITYTPPEGEAREGIALRAVLAAANRPDCPADRVSFDPLTGDALATWEEGSTDRLAVGCTYEARIIRERGGDSRLIYTRKVLVR